ncbi:MAG TPA: GNAT family N-acetyltransferase [Bacillales bacterium]|nr:GNAT family N-acetyltransferase [Bacillales bacterium]
MIENIQYTPWDARIFGIGTYELLDTSEETLNEARDIPGHLTVKVDPLQSKQLLHQYGFYYCDTLLKPSCSKETFRPFYDERISMSRDTGLNDLLSISDGVYRHGRFHRDFHLDKSVADQRYNQWLSQLYDKGHAWGLLYDGKLAGFMACENGRILLQALHTNFQGRGLGKYFWSTGCRTLFSAGFDEISTSISACNLAVLNIVTSLGFKIRGAVDVYHKLNTKKN